MYSSKVQGNVCLFVCSFVLYFFLLFMFYFCLTSLKHSFPFVHRFTEGEHQWSKCTHTLTQPLTNNGSLLICSGARRTLKTAVCLCVCVFVCVCVCVLCVSLCV